MYIGVQQTTLEYCRSECLGLGTRNTDKVVPLQASNYMISTKYSVEKLTKDLQNCSVKTLLIEPPMDSSHLFVFSFLLFSSRCLFHPITFHPIKIVQSKGCLLFDSITKQFSFLGCIFVLFIY